MNPAANSVALPRSTLWLGRAIGTLNFYLLGRGLAGLVFGAFRVEGLRQHSQPRYFWHAYYSMVGINFVFIIVLLIISALLLIGTVRGVRAYAAAVILLLVYFFLEGAFWLLPDPVGISIAAATGVGNLGLATYEFFPSTRGFFLPYVYPVLSAVLLWGSMRWSTRKQQQIPPAKLTA